MMSKRLAAKRAALFAVFLLIGLVLPDVTVPVKIAAGLLMFIGALDVR